MLDKNYFSFIRVLQEILLVVGIGVLIVLPIYLTYYTESVPENIYSVLFSISLWAVFLVMAIRPLADLFPTIRWIRPLVILRKGFGVLSASIVVALMLSRFMDSGFEYVVKFFSAEHWSLVHGAILAPLGDVSALILLVTSNKYSKRVLKSNWKRVQKLAYLYFYSGALYEFLLLDQVWALLAIIVVATLTFGAYLRNRLPPPLPV